MGNHHLYMWTEYRRQIIARHDFYVTESKSRLLSGFTNIDDEYQNTFDEVFEQLRQSAPPEFDAFDGYEAAQDFAYQRQKLLSEMLLTTRFMILNALYHQWEKDIRKFIEKELLNSSPQKAVSDFISSWHKNADVFDCLTNFGWDVKQQPFYEKIIMAGRLVNISKHGKGKTYNHVRQNFPQYLHPENDLNHPDTITPYDENQLVFIDEKQLDELSQSFRDFWAAFPERLSHPPQSKSATIPTSP